MTSIEVIVAEHGRDAEQTRTKQALAAAKARGAKLGNPANLAADSAARVASCWGGRPSSARVAKRLADLEPVIRSIRSEGVTPLR